VKTLINICVLIVILVSVFLLVKNEKPLTGYHEFTYANPPLDYSMVHSFKCPCRHKEAK